MASHTPYVQKFVEDIFKVVNKIIRKLIQLMKIFLGQNITILFFFFFFKSNQIFHLEIQSTSIILGNISTLEKPCRA